jgi:hypothetical protein
VVSTNGVQWSWISAPSPSSANLTAAAFGAGKYVLTYDAVGMNSNNFYYSTDGSNWSPGAKIPGKKGAVWDVVFGNNTFVAIAEDGLYYISHDGVFWIQGGIPGGNSISFAAGRFFVPLGAGTNLISEGTGSWAAEATGLPHALGKITLANGLFFGRAGDYFATSTDGTNWVLRTTSPLPGESGLAFDSMRFINVGRRLGSLPGTYDSYVYVSEPFW